MWRSAVVAALVATAVANCPPPGFDSVKQFNLDEFISKRWYVQQQMEGGLEPADLFQCQWAEYVKMDKPNRWGFEIQSHDHIDKADGSTMDLHPCAKIVDASRGKMSVGECFLPKFASGPYWVYLHNETAGVAAVGGGAPSHQFPGGCRTGTGKIGGGLWVFTRKQHRDEGLVQMARKSLKEQGFDLDALKDVLQEGCPTENGHRPRPESKASYARWLVHESDFGTVVTHHNKDDVFGNLISVSDGNGMMDSTGIIYTYLPELDATYQDLEKDNRVSVMFSEKALPQSPCPGAIEAGSCGRVVMQGRLSPVPQENQTKALEYLYSKHSFMKIWGMTHNFVPFWIHPENITEMHYINQDGPQEKVSKIAIDEYLAAPWERPTSLSTRDVEKPSKGYKPRPHFWKGASLARWIVHEAEYAVVGSHDDNAVGVESTAVSISDGPGYEKSTGVITMYLSPAHELYKNIQKDNRVSLTWTEMQIGNATAPGCTGNTAESPGCARLNINGRLTKVPDANKSVALAQLFQRHPEMKSWGSDFEPFWIAPQDLDEFFLVPMYGGAEHFTIEQWFEAPWFKGGPSPGPAPYVPSKDKKLACNVCGHVFNADSDAGGTPFENLPASWKCPVCGAPKSAYKPIGLHDGSVAWVHDEHSDIIV